MSFEARPSTEPLADDNGVTGGAGQPPDSCESSAVAFAGTAAAVSVALKEKRKPKYLRRVSNSIVVDEDSSRDDGGANVQDITTDEMDGTSTVSQPLVSADIQLHSFGEPLPNVWAMKATGEWEAYEAKRADQQRIRNEWQERERVRQEKWKELSLKKIRVFFDTQNAFGCRRGCWERRLIDSGDEASMRERIINYEAGNTETNLMDDSERQAKFKKIKQDWAKVGLNVALKACRDRRIWPGGHLPELRSRLTRFDTGEPLGANELREPESEEEESEEDELDSEEEFELERQREARKQELARWKALTPEQQAAEKKAKEQKAKEEKKRLLDELKERRRQLRSSPPEACEFSTGTIDPLETVAPAAAASAHPSSASGVLRRTFPASTLEGWRLTGVCAGEVGTKPKNPKVVAVPLPSEVELRSWVLEAQEAFWEARWKYIPRL